MEIVGFLTLSLFFPFKLRRYTKADMYNMENFAFKLVKITPFFPFLMVHRPKAKVKAYTCVDVRDFASFSDPNVT